MKKENVILFIDDEPDILIIIEMRLKNLGYEILVASSGDEGIKLALEKRPGLIFLDLLMPEKDGLKVCREMRGKIELRGVPIVLFTALEVLSEGAMDEKSIEMMAREAGAQDYMKKPFESTEVLAKIEKFLGERV